MPENVLEMRGIVKDFAGIRALDDVDFDVQAGEVHALIGENGAGKSTLMNVLAGRFGNYDGSIVFNQREVRIANPRLARNLGIAVIYQDLTVLPNLTVAENIMLGDEKVGKWTRMLDRRVLRAEAERAIQHLDFELDPEEKVSNLSTAKQCLVEIAGAIRRNARLLVFDEPTAALSGDDVAKLFHVIRELKRKGLAIIYISHRLAELSEIADRVTVLRDGRVVGTRNISECKLTDLTRMMLGRDLGQVFPEKRNRPGPVVLEAHRLHRPGVFEEMSFELREGEILGIAGLVGSGRTEVVRALFGADNANGSCRVYGNTMERRSPHLCRIHGIGLVPENRKREGNITGRPVSENSTIGVLDRLSGFLGFLAPRRVLESANRLIETMHIEPPLTGMPIENLSGGNQQKVIVGRWLAVDPKILIFDEPTQGIDVGTKAQIYKLIVDLAAEGRAVILISSEFSEVSNLADRVLIFREGRLIREIPSDQATEDRLFCECSQKD